jgi:hypothetical protein
MATKNDVTGDKIMSGKGDKSKFDIGSKLIKPSCLPDCIYLINTMSKCRVCDWKDESLAPTKGKSKYHKEGVK